MIRCLENGVKVESLGGKFPVSFPVSCQSAFQLLSTQNSAAYEKIASVITNTYLGLWHSARILEMDLKMDLLIIGGA